MAYYVTELFREKGVSGFLRDPVGAFDTRAEAEALLKEWVAAWTAPRGDMEDVHRLDMRAGIHWIRIGNRIAHTGYTIEGGPNE